MAKYFVSVDELLRHYTTTYNTVHFCFEKFSNNEMKLYLTLENHSEKTITFRVDKGLTVLKEE